MTLSSMGYPSIESLSDVLLQHGRSVGAFMPWHGSEEPYYWLVAESLVRLTTRNAAKQAFKQLVAAFPSWETLACASEQDIAHLVAVAGLQNQRSRQLKRLAKSILELDCQVPRDRAGLMRLPGVGEYVADAVQLHLFQVRTLPIDNNLQRVLGRCLGFSVSSKTRRTNPYKIVWVKDVVDRIVSQKSALELKAIHLGLLDVAWEHCRYLPIHNLCPVEGLCRFAAIDRNQEEGLC